MMGEMIDQQTQSTLAAVDRFNEAFNRHDVDAVMAAMTDDCVFESTSPPDGDHFDGQASVRTVWEGFFASTPTARFAAEEQFAAGDRCVVRWRYTWQDNGEERHLRGVDVLRVRDGKLAEKLAYVKG